MFYRFGRAIIKLLNLILYNIHVEGEENIPETGGVVLCPNHISNYDPLAVATHMKRQVHFLAKAELYKNFIVRKVLLAVGTIPVDRGKVSLETLKESLRVLKNGEILGIFPEGTRVKNGEHKKPMEGFVVFALKTKSPILPVHIEGEYKFRGKINIKFGKPIELNEYYGKKVKPEEMSKISEKIMDIVYDLQ
ncbi:1-acyl-sn-glycerol-3-phosphate acyltransferase [Eubacterium callanderi]|uniref:1-acyl-sn-glycerol-3-phosphate acyltransferase n=2 Tax=Eubacterium callanderi TaxID=53442 RepID=A0AB74F3P4_9FIRM|nr:lysophospholipid acyltransferase family protein [Eubacterium callanderi]OEZ03154.1 1-acyl-sn-glycerol-3-phosphate acyltransferase [[Butyribacterium] methylotrophicum]ADO37489.1 1-acyl-sn-glycerol-3-phosphate acyltransferase [Eubacterium callanderi]MCB6659722.1 1-acyl-sn-glycerol-3-phosphate acyltransferase [Eubacterium callanderi]MCB6752602.1 1-acyl-sn-glycerol-3-phosphate acyltransferase [Eubacterium callanderi]MCB7104356.1 1-acyl-sn-glycerol-3-phosphate acyltransferase [Eubacterium callan